MSFSPPEEGARHADLKKSPATVRGRYIRQIQGKMAPVKGRRYEKFAGSEDLRVNPTHADVVEKQSDILE